MRIIYIPKKVSPITTIKYGLLYNWFAASSPATVEYGYLYNWYSISDSRNIANTGWHIPTYAEMQTLSTYLGGTSVAGGKLKYTGTTYWDSPNTGATNEVGFNAKGGGYRVPGTGNGNFLNKNLISYYWSSTLSPDPVVFKLTNDNSIMLFTQLSGGQTQGSVCRLLCDSSTDPGTYIGNDGRSYQTVQIGTQVWLAEDLAETKYRNGDAIPEVTDNAAWVALTTGARCAYNNTITNVGLGSAIANTGWHVPSYLDYLSLFSFIDPTGTYGSNIVGGVLKETGLVYWIDPNVGATNGVSFNGRGSGMRSSIDGLFKRVGEYLKLWNIDEYSADINNGLTTSIVNFLALIFTSTNSPHGFSRSADPKKDGLSVRLLKDSTSLSHGQTGIYVGNDGKTYRTICMGTQEWIADNLAETKYRDGSTIPEVTVDATWAALTTGARCSYNNDPSNV